MIARKAGAAALVFLALALGLGTPQPAQASACSGGTGVSVVVDFSQYGGVQTGCAPNPTNGFAALSQAGFSVVQPTMAPGFVCRIDGAPPAEDEACVRTPPETAYWSYWQAAPGSTAWTYSGQGAGSSQPRQGGTDGWAFGAGTPPGIPARVNTAAPPPPPPPPPPAPAPAPAPAPTTSARPPAGPAPPGGGESTQPDPTTAAPGGASPTLGAPGSSPAPSSVTTAPTGSGTAESTAVAAEAGASSQETAAASEAATESASTGAPWGSLLAGVAAAALAGGAFWQVRRRR